MLFLLIPLIFFLFWFNVVNVVSSLIIAYLFFILITRKEVLSTLFAGCFLWLFESAWLLLRNEQLIKVKQYALLLLLGSVVILLIHRAVDLMFSKNINKFKKIWRLIISKLLILILILKNKKHYKIGLSLFWARLIKTKKHYKIVFLINIKKTILILRNNRKQYKVYFLIFIKKINLVFIKIKTQSQIYLLIFLVKTVNVLKKILILYQRLVYYFLFIINKEVKKRGIWFFIKILALIILFVCLSLFTKLALSNILICVFVCYGILFRRDGGISVSLAIIFIFSTMFYLLKKDKEVQAETMAVYAYYFLVIGTTHSLLVLNKKECRVVDN